MQFLTSSIPFLRRYRRKRLHKDYVYKNMLQLRNEAVRLLISVSSGDDIQKARAQKAIIVTIAVNTLVIRIKSDLN